MTQSVLKRPISIDLVYNIVASIKPFDNMVGVFAIKALELFPDIKGTASSTNVAIRQLLAAILVFISELTFDGTIIPVAILIFTYTCIALIWYITIAGTERAIIKLEK